MTYNQDNLLKSFLAIIFLNNSITPMSSNSSCSWYSRTQDYRGNLGPQLSRSIAPQREGRQNTSWPHPLTSDGRFIFNTQKVEILIFWVRRQSIESLDSNLALIHSSGKILRSVDCSGMQAECWHSSRPIHRAMDSRQTPLPYEPSFQFSSGSDSVSSWCQHLIEGYSFSGAKSTPWPPFLCSVWDLTCQCSYHRKEGRMCEQVTEAHKQKCKDM